MVRSSSENAHHGVKSMAKRTPPDWEGIEKEFRSGQLSIREIARRYGLTDGAIRKKAKECLWQRDLVQEVRDAVRTKLVREEVRITDATDREIIEAAATRGAEVVRIHRSDIRAGQAVVAKLSKQLFEAIGVREDLEKEVVAATKGAKGWSRREKMLRAISIPSHAGVIRDLSVALKNLIPLERQAFNLDDRSRATPYDDLSEDEILQRIEELEAKFKGRRK